MEALFDLYLRRYRTGAVLCAFAYYATTYGPVLLSGYAAISLQVARSTEPEVILAAGLAAIISTVGAFAGFREKWHANRDAVYSLRLLQLDGPNEQVLREGLSKILLSHADAWRRTT